MAALATQVISVSGLAPSYAAASGGGDTFTPDADTVIHVKNGGGSPITVTVVTPRVDPSTGLAEADVSVSVPNAGERFIGPFPAEVYADPTTRVAAIGYSAVTSVTVAVLQAPRR